MRLASSDSSGLWSRVIYLTHLLFYLFESYSKFIIIMRESPTFAAINVLPKRRATQAVVPESSALNCVYLRKSSWL